MGFSAKAATKGARLRQAPPALFVTAPFLDSTDRFFEEDFRERFPILFVPRCARCPTPAAWFNGSP